MPAGDETPMQAAHPTPRNLATRNRTQSAPNPVSVPQPRRQPSPKRRSAGQPEPAMPVWKPAVLMGTAATVTTAVLSMQAPAPQQAAVQPAISPLPLAQDQQLGLAQGPTQSSPQVDGDCSAICRDLRHIQTQMSTVRQYITQRQTALQALQTQTGVSQPQGTAQAIARYVQTAETQEQRLGWEANQLRRDLMQLNQQLGLAPESSAADLLNGQPDYQQLLQQWQQVDRQLAESSNAAALKGPVWNPAEHDFPAPTASKESLLSQHQQLSDQLQSRLESLYLQPAQTLLPDLEEAIASDPLRLAYFKPWLTKTHRLQLIESRHQTVQYLVNRLNQQHQTWQRLAQRQDFLEADIARAQETLATHTAQAQRLQNHLHAEQRAVSSPGLISAN